MIWTDIDGIPCALFDQYQWLYFNWYIICFNSYDLIKGHYEGQGSSSAIQNHHLSVITNLCLHFYSIKPTWAFKQQPVLKWPFLILEANALIWNERIIGVKGHKVHFMCDQVPIF